MFRQYVLASLTLLFFGFAATPTYADVIQLFPRDQLTPGGATVDFPNVTPGFVGSIFTPPLTVPTGGTNVTFTTGVPAAAGGRLLRVNQGVGFFGDFAANTEVLVTENGSGVPSGSLSISFSIPITEFGLDAQNTFAEADEFSTFTFSLFHEARLLGIFSRSGADTSGTFFLGARATLGQQITRITINGASTIVDSDGDGIPDSDAQNNFGIAQVTFTPIPEPTTMLLLGTGLAGAAVTRRRKRKE